MLIMPHFIYFIVPVLDKYQAQFQYMDVAGYWKLLYVGDSYVG